MNTTAESMVSRWHHRVLGTLWGLFGSILGGWNVIHNIRNEDLRNDLGLWIVPLIMLAYVVTGVGFFFGRMWARIVMVFLMLLAVFFSVDMVLMSGWTGNPEGLPKLFAVFGIATYTLLFVLITAAWRCIKYH
jgi:hypothetical protein